VASAQVKSCVLIAGLLAAGETRVREPHQSRDHTERILLGAHTGFTRADDGWLAVSHLDELELGEVIVPGDPSSAAFWIAAAAVVPDSRIVIDGVGLNWTRTGFIRIADRMGAVIVGDLEEPGTFTPEEPIGDLDVAHSPLEGTEVVAAEVPASIDEIPLVALMGVFAEGETVVRGAGELRVKESDRIMGVVEGLGGLGADIEPTDDGFVVRGTGRLRGGTIDSRGDHRLAMLGAVAGLASEEGVEVEGFEAVSISYPGFERDLERLLAG
jgi:3-phosphoshikimate 1-carboxyvinyltransferase